MRYSGSTSWKRKTGVRSFDYSQQDVWCFIYFGGKLFFKKHYLKTTLTRTRLQKVKTATSSTRLAVFT